MGFKSSSTRSGTKLLHTYDQIDLGQPLSGGGGEDLTQGRFTFTSGPLSGTEVALTDNINYAYGIDDVGTHEITFNDSFSINMEIIGGGAGGAGGGGGTPGGGGQPPSPPGNRGIGAPSTVTGPVSFGNVISGGGAGGITGGGVGGVSTITSYTGPSNDWTQITGTAGAPDPAPGTGGGTGQYVVVDKHDVYYGYDVEASKCSSGKSGDRSAGQGGSMPGGGGAQGAYLLGQNISVQSGDVFTIVVGSGGNGTSGTPNQAAGGAGGYGRPGSVSFQVYFGND